MVNETVNVKTRKKYAKVAAIFNDALTYTKSTHKYDEYLQAFVYGCGGILSDWQKEKTNQFQKNQSYLREKWLK